MASVITLEGIDQTISNLKYKNKNTLKYRFIQHIRQYYNSENSVVTLNEIDHEDLIKMLWDTDHSLEAIKNKRKNLNGVRSSVNADLKKLYEKGENPEGIKIGSNNIFVMSEDAKDKILKKVGYDLQPDGILKLDQIMDILKLASETVTGSMAVEDTDKKGGSKKIDRLKDLIKGLSEKVGLGSPELSSAPPEVGDMAGKGDEDGSGSMEMAGVLDEGALDKVDEVAAISDLEDDVEYIEGGAEEEILDDVEDVEIDGIADTETDDLVEAAEIDEEVEDVLDAEDTELEYVEDVDEVEEMLEGETSEEQAGESGSGDEDPLEGIGLGQDSGQETTGKETGGDEALSKDAGTELEAGDKEDGEGVGHDMAGKGDEDGSGSMEMAGVLDEGALDKVDEVAAISDLEDDVEYIEGGAEEEILDDVEDVEIDGIADTETDDLVEAAEIDEEVEDVLDAEDTELEYVEDVDEVEEMLEGETSEEQAGESGSGDEDPLEGIGLGQDSGQETTGKETGGDEALSKDAGTELEAGDKEDGEGVGHDMAGKGDEDGSGSMEMAGVLDEGALDKVDEVAAISDLEDDVEYIEGGAEEEILDDVEDVEIDGIADTETDDLVEAAEIDEEVEDVLDAEDTELEYVEDVDEVEEMLEGETSEEQAGESGSGDEDPLEGIGLGQDSGQETTGKETGGDEALSKDAGTELEAGDKEDGEGVGHDMAGKAEHKFEAGGEQKGNEQLGLPVGSLGQEHSIEADSNLKKDKLLAEEFDGYLGSMDRHYNHYLLIPGGEYIIGSKNPKKDEKSEQVVYLEPFYFGRFPITNGLFEIFVEKTGYKTTAEKVGYGTVYHGRFEKKKDKTTGLITSTWNSSLYCETIEGACWYQPSGPKSTLYNKRNHPVVQISMEDAMAFAAWTGKRLPTENEWEAASRTANGWIFPWGPEWKKDASNIEDSCTADTTSVDKYVEFENDFGIVDTIGNVLEWTNDSFGSTSQNNNGAKYRAVRGGSWISGYDIRLFSRFLTEPESHSNILGFRCVAY